MQNQSKETIKWIDLVLTYENTDLEREKQTWLMKVSKSEKFYLRL
jgi:hypothetical protein